MYSVFLLLVVLALQTHGFTLGDVQCTYVYTLKYQKTDIYNVVEYNSSISDCNTEDVPNIIDFVAIQHEGDTSITSLKINFTLPKRECRYGVVLLVDSSVKDERECENYEFKNAGNINLKVHTVEKNLCFLRNLNELVKYNDNSTKFLHEDNIDLWFTNIFTGCYTLQFHLGGQKYVTRNHVFVKTSYQDLITQPQFVCKYNTYSVTGQRHEITNFTLDISLSADIGKLLKVRFIPIRSDKPCTWKEEWFEQIWNVSLLNDVLKDNNINVLKDKNNNCSLKEEQMASGEYIKTVQCNFQVQVALPTDYCSIFELVDDRCKGIVSRLDTEPCIWVKRCVNSFESMPHIESTKVIASSSYLLLPIIAVILIISTIVGALCFLRYVRIRKEEVNLYVNPQHDDFLNPTCLKSTTFGIVDSNEKGIDHDNTACDDIVLLYTKSSTSFMTLMKDFRETLAKICCCSVYDWHDGAEWNNVAKVGAVLWFTELFNSGCRVVWIDTPTSRSVVTSNSRESNTNVNKFNKYYEIGDFRDVAFPVVLDLAKRNTRNVIHQYRRHFVVRFEDLENTRNLNDPFLDLSPHARYLMPQHLMQLCLDLSVVKPISSKYQIKVEQDLLQQRLESLM